MELVELKYAWVRFVKSAGSTDCRHSRVYNCLFPRPSPNTSALKRCVFADRLGRAKLLCGLASHYLKPTTTSQDLYVCVWGEVSVHHFIKSAHAPGLNNSAHCQK